MKTKRNIALMAAVAALSLASCGQTNADRQSDLLSEPVVVEQENEKKEEPASVSVGYILVANNEKAADLYDEINGNVVLKMFTGDAITVYSINSDWAKINYGGKDGYVKLENVSFTEPEKESPAETPAAEVPELVKEPEPSPAEEKPAPTEVPASAENTPVKVENAVELNNTNEINITFLTDMDGFRIADPVKSYPMYSPQPSYQDGYCNTYAAYIFSQPDANSVKRETDMLYQGDPVQILGSVGSWYYIATDNGSNGLLHGYVQQSYITVGKIEVQKINYNATQGQVKAGMTAWVNYSPSKTDNKEVLSGGTGFTIIGNANDYWYQIEYYGGTGWISYKMVDVW